MLSTQASPFFDFHFFPVGEKSKPGDATCFRYGKRGVRTIFKQTVFVIDAGTQKTGSEISELIKDKYDTDEIDYAFLTHPHDDHIQGFFKIIEDCKVKNLVIHKPWVYSDQVLKIIGDGRRTVNSIKNKLQSVMDALYSLYEKAKSKNIHIIDAIHDHHRLPKEIQILGPNLNDYIALLPRILIEKNEICDSPIIKSQAQILLESISTKQKLEFYQESLLEPDIDDVNAFNNTSVVILVTLLGRQFLFTGDSSSYAIEKYIKRSCINLKRPFVFHIPHHGSKRNVGPNFLTRICGEIDKKYEDPYKCFGLAVVSLAQEEDDKHPSNLVVNALRRRGYLTPIIRDNVFHVNQTGFPNTFEFFNIFDEYKYI